MAGFEFDKAIRWARLDRSVSLSRRSEGDLPFLTNVTPGPGLLLDTCVYIDSMQGKLAAVVEQLTGRRVVNHSTVGITELMFAVGRLDPTDSRTPSTITQIGTVVKGMNPRRVLTPDADILGRAAILGGVLSRMQGYGKDDRLRATNDCILFLQAAKHGLAVLSRNLRDFDLLLQLMPAGRVLFYRQA